MTKPITNAKAESQEEKENESKFDYFRDALEATNALRALAVLISNPDTDNSIRLDSTEVDGLALILRLISQHSIDALCRIDPNLGIR